MWCLGEVALAEAQKVVMSNLNRLLREELCLTGMRGIVQCRAELQNLACKPHPTSIGQGPGFAGQPQYHFINYRTCLLHTAVESDAFLSKWKVEKQSNRCADNPTYKETSHVL